MTSTSHETNRDRRTSKGTALLRALAAALIMAVGLVAATEASGAFFGVGATAASGLGSRIVVAACVTVIVVGLILLLRRRWDRRSLAGIGLTGLRSSAAGFGIGFGVLAGAGVAVLLVLDVTGVIRLVTFDPLQLLGFVATNTVVALLLEAIPEEFAIRGYALTNLRDAFPSAVAVLLSIGVFLVVPLVALSAQWMLMAARGMGESFSFAPGGDDPVVYYTMLAAFGYLLVCARDATASATVWTCVGAHLAWLTMNRIVLGAEGAEFLMDELGLLLFFGGYATLAIFAFTWLGTRHRARADSQNQQPVTS